jgi:hypothetical protein
MAGTPRSQIQKYEFLIFLYSTQCFSYTLPPFTINANSRLLEVSKICARLRPILPLIYPKEFAQLLWLI